VAAGDEDRLFGSVTAADIAEAIAREGIQIDKKKIQVAEPIKKLGIYSIEVRVSPEVTVPVKIWVVKE
jgi:large subunit ribosomal protein L9